MRGAAPIAICAGLSGGCGPGCEASGTIALIAANVFVYFFVQPHSRAVQEAKFTYDHAAIPYEVTHDRPLTPRQICESVAIPVLAAP